MHRTWDKVFIGIMALGYMIASVFLILLALGWTGFIAYAEQYLLYFTNRWVMGLSGVAVFIASSALFLGSLRAKPDAVTAIHETSLGQVNITMPALEHLIIKAAKSIPGVREVRPALRNAGGGIAVNLKVQVVPDTGIPQLTEDLQKKVRDYLQKTAGIGVQEIRVSVNKISWDVKSRVD